MENDGFW
ncbi:Protein of unknown function [Bacillus wiedmannii]|nr:Protein of unknown function [Bacillus wiedmannii]